MSNKFIDVLTDFFSEATDLCGSEGLFQSLFYHHLRTYFQKENILREYSVSQGKIDFVIIDDEAAIAIEFKGGANSNRNSLESMMNNDNSKKQKGFIHDLEKLKKFKTKCKEKEKTIPWLVCLDLNDLGLAFSGSDIQKYSKKAQQYQSHFAYFSQFESDFQTFRNGQKRDNPIERVTQKQATMDPYMVMQNKSFWAEYFSEVTDAEPECAHVGKLYHKFRVAGLKNNQCTSELFLKCNRKSNSPNAYYRPDFALFTDDFNGQFQLFEKGNKENSNDKFKLPCLKVIFEFKGGESFSKKNASKKKEDITEDINKLVEVYPHRIEFAAKQRYGVKIPPKYILVITDPDSNLSGFIAEITKEYERFIEVFWAGNYQSLPTDIYLQGVKQLERARIKAEKLIRD